MIEIRRSEDRGHSKIDWLDTRYSFSFADYYDPEHMGFRVMRVLNEDRIQGGGGFPPHSHRDMEIVTLIHSGTLEHRDNLGNTSVIGPGEVQRMSAGKGVTHSEFNHSSEDSIHLYQIWFFPDQRDIQAGYEQKFFPEAAKRGRWCRILSPRGEEGAVSLHQDITGWTTLLSPGEKIEYSLSSNRYAWIQVESGDINLNAESLKSGDGAAVSRESLLKIECHSASNLFVFDLP